MLWFIYNVEMTLHAVLLPYKYIQGNITSILRHNYKQQKILDNQVECKMLSLISFRCSG